MAMSVKEAMTLLQGGVEKLSNDAEFKRYLDLQANLYRYSVNNILLILAQTDMKARHVEGFRTWKTKYNRSVKKGEKGILIIQPAFYKKKNEETGEEEQTMYFKTGYVFDISQTDGDPVPEIGQWYQLSGNDVDNTLLEAAVLSSPVPVTFEDYEGSSLGFYRPSEKFIKVKKSLAGQEKFACLVHEMAHAILDVPEKESRDVEEVKAESTSYIVCKHFGIDQEASSFAYVANWADGDVKKLQGVLDIISKTARQIIESIEDQLTLQEIEQKTA